MDASAEPFESCLDGVEDLAVLPDRVALLDAGERHPAEEMSVVTGLLEGVFMSHPEYERAAQLITQEAVRDTLMDMVNINSPTGGELGMAQYIVGRLAKAGLHTYLQDVDEGRPNAIGRLAGAGTGLNLLLTGHMDTTWHGDEPFLTAAGHKAHASHSEGWVWGLGSNNMKSGLAAALVAVEALARAEIRLKGDVIYGAVVGEIEKAQIDEFQGRWLDGLGAGTRHMIMHGISADYAILCEPTGLRVCTVNMGAVWAKISVAGTLSHAGRSKDPGVVNAVELMHDLHTELRHWIAEYEATHEFRGEHPNVTISAIRGGMPWRASSNPIECRLYLDIRIVPGTSVENIRRSLREMLATHAGRTGTLEAQLEFYVTNPPTALPDNLPIEQALREAHQRVAQAKAGTFIRRAGSDASHMNSHEVPCIIYGPGGRNHPSVKSMDISGEHASVENLVIAAKVYLDTAMSICDR